MKNSKYIALMRRNIKIAYIQSAFEYINFFLPIWYAFETQFASAAALSIVYAVSHLITTALELPTGALADLLGRKKTITLGLLIQSIAWFIVSQSQNFGYIWIGYILIGIGSALISGSDTALYYDSLIELKEEGRFSQINAKLVTVSQAVMVFGSLAGGYLYEFNQRLPYIFSGLSVFIAALVGLLYTEPAIDSECFSIRNYFRQTKSGFQQIFRNAYTKQLAIYYVLVGSVTWYFLYFLDLAYLTEAGFSSIERGWIFSAISVICPLIIVYLTHARWLKKEAILIGFPLIIFFGFTPSYWLPKMGAIGAFMLVYFAAVARFSFLDQYVNEGFESKYRATAISTLNMSVSVVFAISSILASFVIDSIGSKGIMTVLGIITFTLILPVTVVLIRKMRIHEALVVINPVK